MEQILNVWDFPFDSPEDDDHEEEQELLLWWCDEYLRMLVGPKTWGNEQRFYKMMVDKCYIPALKEEKVCVTTATEAFGLLIYENCREKWIKTFEYKQEHGKDAVLPTKKNDPASAQFKGKFSDSQVGSIKGGGWSVDAFKNLNTYIAKVQQQRTEDKDEGWTMHKLAKTLIRKKHDITADGPRRGRRRKKKDAAPEPQQEVVELMVLDE